MYQENLVKCFLLGVKDAVLLHEGEYGVDFLKNKRYPRKIYTRKFNGCPVTDCWFFKNKEIKQKFVDLGIHNKLKKQVFDHHSMGTILGFPPSSINTFTVGDYEDSDKIGVDYCGMSYMSYKNTIIDDLVWLHKERGEFKNNNMIIKLHSFETSREFHISADSYFNEFEKSIASIQRIMQL